MKKILIALLLATTGSLQAHAASIRGYGAGACSAWLSERDAIQRKEVGAPEANIGSTQWIFGFLSAMNASAGKAVELSTMPDVATVGYMVDKECRDEPNQTIADAAAAVWFKLIAKRK